MAALNGSVRALSAGSAENSARLGSISSGECRGILLASDEGIVKKPVRSDFYTGHH